MPKTPEKLLEMPQGTKDQEEVTQESEETIPEGSTGVSDDVTEVYADMGGASDEREAYEEEMLDEGEEPKDEEPEIAEMLGISGAACRSRISRARKMLRERLDHFRD